MAANWLGSDDQVKQTLFKALALIALIATPAIAEAATRGFSIANVNMRSGPSTAYPAVVVIPNGAPLVIHGCLQDRPWCDVSFNRGRGWVSGNYIQAENRQRRYDVEPRRYRELGVPIITFELGRYWDQHYRNNSFYGERERWRRPPPRGGYWDSAPPPRADRGPDRRPPSPPPSASRPDDRRPVPPRFERPDDRRPSPRAERNERQRGEQAGQRPNQADNRQRPSRSGDNCPPGRVCN